MSSSLRNSGVAREPPPSVVSTRPTATGRPRRSRSPIARRALRPCAPDAMPDVNLLSPVGRVIATVVARLRDRRRRDVPISLPTAPADEARPSVPPAYMPLYTYLNRRYAGTVVLTFEQIEALLGFAPPSRAFADADWWTGAGEAQDRHTAAWTAA